ncbi:MAG: hypothetical protein ABIP27_14170 [Flavobacterium circumlabens]|uniref:hypothetical protein n=1 Tax=Flavobacterium circumlabens TaxID=2133765 RepID=UPI003266E7B2
MTNNENGSFDLTFLKYYTYANKDFTALESALKLLFVPKSERACIDGDSIEKYGVFIYLQHQLRIHYY